KPNQPLYVAKVAECIADLRGLSVEALAEQTRKNFFRCFSDARSDAWDMGAKTLTLPLQLPLAVKIVET
ncbi:hypothetical protein QQ73_21400, partial [Candidatus Endoriftia persephone str. Guaymas]|nr:hypothetical protein [Candidatus Endoriftia persephone str. Guaymas]